MRVITHCLYILISALFIYSCSSTRVIPEGEYRLLDNKVRFSNIEQNPEYNASEIESYIYQKPNSYIIGTWNPFINVYNWSNGKGKSWDKLVQKVGIAPVVLDSLKLEDSEVNMQKHLEYQGYFNSTVSDSLVLANKKAKVYYNVTLGRRYPIKKINYTIADKVLDSIYKENLAASLVKPGDYLSESALEQESERMTSIFREEGFYSFSKNYFFFSADTTIVRDSAILDVEIRNYTRNESSQVYRPHTRYTIGDIYVQPVSDILRYRVALNNNLNPVVDTIRYNDINILSDGHLLVRKSTLDNMNVLQTGTMYSENMVNLTYQRFTNLNIYNSVNVEMRQSDSSVVDCYIRLLPSKTNGYKVDFELSTNSTGLLGISPALSYYNRNIFRGGEWLNVSLMGNFQKAIQNSTVGANEFGASTGISLPTFLLLPGRSFKKESPRTEIVFAYNFLGRPEFMRNMISLNFGYTWSTANKHWYYQIYPINFNLINMSNESPDFIESLKDPFVQDTYKDHFDVGGSTTISYYSDPSQNPRKTNFKAKLSLDIAGNLLSAFKKYMPLNSDGYGTISGIPFSQYVRAELTLTKTFKFGRDNASALATRFVGGYGYAYGNSGTMPFERLFWAGGANSLRGWQARGVGPGAAPLDETFSIPNQTGDIRLEMNLEYRFPLFWFLNGAVFFDAGNVWQLDRRIIRTSSSESSSLGYFNKNFLKTMAFNTGIGIRLDVDFVVIRFDWGIKLYEPQDGQWQNVTTWLRPGGSAFQFSIGYPF